MGSLTAKMKISFLLLWLSAMAHKSPKSPKHGKSGKSKSPKSRPPSVNNGGWNSGSRPPYGGNNNGSRPPYGGSNTGGGNQYPSGGSNSGSRPPYGGSNSGSRPPYGGSNNGSRPPYQGGGSRPPNQGYPPYDGSNSGSRPPYQGENMYPSYNNGGSNSGSRYPYESNNRNNNYRYNYNRNRWQSDQPMEGYQSDGYWGSNSRYPPTDGATDGSRDPYEGNTGSRPPSVSGPCPKTPDVGFPFDNSSCTNNGYKIVCKAGCRNRRYQFVECKLSGYNANKWRYRKRC